MDANLKTLSDAAIQKFQKKQYSAAAIDFKTVITALEKADDPLDLAETRNNLCVTLIQLGDAQGALDAVTGTDEVFAAAKDVKRQGMALANRGNALESLKRPEEAIACYEQARDCLRSSGEKQMLSIVLRSLADLQMKTGKKFQALDSLQNSYTENPDGKARNKFFSTAIGQLIKKITGR
jgi:tetratricopeptide (TPR) repeat protein